MTDAPSVDPAQAINAVMVMIAIIIGLFFRRYGRAAIAGVIAGGIVVAILAWGVLSPGGATGDPYHIVGYIAGRVLFTFVLGALFGCLIRRGFARMFGRGNKPAAP